MPERNVTHSKLAPVARLMGYTVNGLIELCQSAADDEWRIIGLTRSAKLRVAARWNDSTSRYEFSIGEQSFVLTRDEATAQSIRAEIAETIVRRVKAGRSKETEAIIRGASIQGGTQPSSNEQQSSSSGATQGLIISPLAPRGPNQI